MLASIFQQQQPQEMATFLSPFYVVVYWHFIYLFFFEFLTQLHVKQAKQMLQWACIQNGFAFHTADSSCDQTVIKSFQSKLLKTIERPLLLFNLITELPRILYTSKCVQGKYCHHGS